ncbi:hypothetical protein GCM10007989_25170 [Devosia pacifica]|uniref:Uncharacterized protein n=1 Tax=Devosia pacifica TaxID=1335967 RepID=A0A918VW07_9HYPH|nr:hypothetical protein GCM10007989_25170 [Devosia pacifica]
MRDVGDTGLLMLDLDLLIELGRHALEVGDHHFNLRQLPTLLIDLKFLEPNEALATRFHDLYSLHPKVPGGLAPTE